MMAQPSYSIVPLGDAALLVYFGNTINDAINKTVLALFHQLKQQSLPGIIDLVPAYSSLAVYYDIAAFRTTQQTAFEVVKEQVESLLKAGVAVTALVAGSKTIPVCYEEKFAPDLESLAQQKNLSVADVIRLHTAVPYRVYTIGFLPGFAYMGRVDDRIAAPRKSNPATVAAGSVGIAGGQTGIYPFRSPGGWNIIGRTPVRLFDKTNPEPVLLQPGDEIIFYPVTEDEFENY